MRIQELLLEYNRQITLQKMGDQFSQVAARENTTAEAAIAALEEMDPTANKQYTPWLARQYIKRQFRLEDADRIRTVLDNFGKIKSRLPVEQRDIGRMDFYQLDKLIDQVLDVKLDVDKPAETGTFPVVPDSQVLYNGPLGQLAIPETHEASCELGRGTKWCTTTTKSNYYFDRYTQKGPLYIWRDKNGEKYQFHFGGELQMMDSRDRPIEYEKLKYFRNEHPVLKKLFKKIESQYLKDPKLALQYAKEVIRGRWPEVEDAIATDPVSASQYAREVIKGRWPKAEEVIAKDPTSAFSYVTEVIKGRWPKAEATIAKDPIVAGWYAREVIKGRWPEAEAVIAQYPRPAAQYAEYVIKGRWPKGEDAIAQNKDTAVEYARFIIKGRFPKAEPLIMKSPFTAVSYAAESIKGRWPEAEATIAKDPWTAAQYAEYVIKGRWPEAEAVIAQYPMAWEHYKKSFGIK